MTIQREQAQFEKIRETIAQGNAIFREALTAMRHASEKFPWRRNPDAGKWENHPADEAERLARRIAENAAAAGVAAPVLAAPDRLTEAELGDIQKLARELAARAEYIQNYWPAPQISRPAEPASALTAVARAFALSL